MNAATWAELLKARHARLPAITATAFVLAAAVAGLFTYIWQDPDRARSLGLLGAKAQLAQTTADWPNFLSLLAQVTAVGGMLIFGTIVIWTFGREFSDHTARDLLALPTSRTAIVVAKFAVAAGWCYTLTLWLFVLGLATGSALDLPGWSTAAAWHGFTVLSATAGMTMMLTPVLALAASIGRGYLPAFGALFGMLFCAQIIAALGYGHLFPFSVPSLYSGIAGTEHAPIGPVGYVSVPTVGLAAVWATVRWWRQADQ